MYSTADERNTVKVTIPNFLAEVGLVLADMHNLTLDDDCTGGVTPLGEDEKLVGVVPEGMTRILYLVSRYYDKLAAEQRVVYEFAADGSKAEDVAAQLGTVYKERADVYRNMFWASVHDTYPPGKGYKGLTLRAGWALTHTPDGDNAIAKLLNLLQARGL